MQTLILPITDSNSLAHALDVLSGGGLVAFPTDTVYGLGAMTFDANAVSKIYMAKGRGQEKAIPILISDMEELEKVGIDIPTAALRLAARFWPGPLTILVPKRLDLPVSIISDLERKQALFAEDWDRRLTHLLPLGDPLTFDTAWAATIQLMSKLEL